MRGVELVIGALFIISGLAGPLVPWASEGSIPLGVDGVLSIDGFTFLGEAAVSTQEAAMRAEGPVEVRITAGVAIVEIVEYELVWLDTRPFYPFWQEFGPGRATIREYSDAEILLSGLEEIGLAEIWPDLQNGVTTFDLSVISDNAAEVRPSARSPMTRSVSSSDRSYIPEPPLIALAHEGTRVASTEDEAYLHLSDVTFERLTATGAIGLFAMDADLVIDHPDGRETVALRNEPYTPTTLVDARVMKSTRALLTLKDAELTVGFEGTRSMFLSKDHEWSINGTVGLQTGFGMLSRGDQ